MRLETLVLDSAAALDDLARMYVDLDVKQAATPVSASGGDKKDGSAKAAEGEERDGWMSQRWWLLDALKRAVMESGRLQSDQQLAALKPHDSQSKEAKKKSRGRGKGQGRGERDEGGGGGEGEGDEEGEHEVYSVSAMAAGSGGTRHPNAPRWSLHWRTKLVALGALTAALEHVREVGAGLPHEWDCDWVQKQQGKGLGVYVVAQLADLVCMYIDICPPGPATATVTLYI